MWTRRDFLVTSSLALGGCLFPRGFAHAAIRADTFTPLRRNVGIYENRGGVMGWLVAPDGVAVVDTQFADTAPAFAEGLRGRTTRRIDVVINSHHHGDHVGGNAALRPLAERLVAHSRAAELMRGAANAAPESLPDTTFDSDWSVELGDERIRARHYGRGAHTGGDATIFFERANVVHMGDLMFNRTYPFIDGPSGASVAGWMAVLDAVRADHSDETTFIFGHAAEGHPVTGTRADLQVQRDFLEAALETVRRGLQAGRSEEEIVGGDAPSGFPQHSGPANRLATLYRVAYGELRGA